MNRSGHNLKGYVFFYDFENNEYIHNERNMLNI